MRELQQWDTVIRPEQRWFSINFREIWQYKDLLFLFVRRDLVAIYKQTILGPLWLFLQPLFTTLTFNLVFNKIAKIPTDSVHPLLFYMSGITLWTYFSDCFNKTANTFIANAGVFGKVYFPRLISPLSIVVSNLIKFGIQMLLFVLVLVVLVFLNKAQIHVSVALLILPFLILCMAVLGLGLGLIFSSLTTKYRDLTFLLQFGIQLLMYATPVIYPLSYTGGKLKQLLLLNPLTSVVETFRYCLLGIGEINWSGLTYSFSFSTIVLLAGIFIFNQVEKNFMDTV